MKKIVLLCSMVIVLMAYGGCSNYVHQAAGPNEMFTSLEPADHQKVYGVFTGIPDNQQMITLMVTGKGVPPEHTASRGQATILAERAAIADAYRRLSEKIKGIYLKSYHQVDNMAVDYDRIRVETETWLRGAELVRMKPGVDDVWEATLRVKIYVSPDHVLYTRRTEPMNSNWETTP